MVSLLALTFWLFLFLLLYTYFGYPLLLWLVSLFKSKIVNRAQIVPTVTLIITVHNEEATITNKIENTLSLDYPKYKLQIIIASDASDDATDTIVSEYKNKGVTLVRAEQRKGKENAQKQAIEYARGDILIFSDVATILNPDVVKNIVSNFNDPTIGCVSSEDRFIDKDGNVSGEGAYVKYEMFLRSLESKVNSLVGVSGSFFAARREVCSEWPINLQSDFNVLLNSIKCGLRGVSDPQSIGFYHNIVDEKKEFQRKIRTILRGICVVMSSISFMNPLRYGFFSLQLISHKLLRWFVPFLLLITLITNIVLSYTSKIFFAFLILQLLFYLWALVGYLARSNSTFFRLPCYFLSVNLAILYAWIKYLAGQRLVVWEPSKR